MSVNKFIRFEKLHFLCEKFVFLFDKEKSSCYNSKAYVETHRFLPPRKCLKGGSRRKSDGRLSSERVREESAKQRCDVERSSCRKRTKVTVGIRRVYPERVEKDKFIYIKEEDFECQQLTN